MLITSLVAFSWAFYNFNVEFLDFEKMYLTSGIRVSATFDGFRLDDRNLVGWIIFEISKIYLIILEFYFCFMVHVGHIMCISFSYSTHHLNRCFNAHCNTQEFIQKSAKNSEVITKYLISA